MSIRKLFFLLCTNAESSKCRTYLRWRCFIAVVVAVAFRPDGKEVAVSTLDGQITFWDVRSAVQVKSVEGRRDIGGGRRASDKITAKTSSSGKYGYCFVVFKLFSVFYNQRLCK